MLDPEVAIDAFNGVYGTHGARALHAKGRFYEGTFTPTESAGLLCRAAHEVAPDKECRLVPGESEALRVALEEMEDDEVVVFLYEKQTDPGLEVLRRYGARPAASVPPAASGRRCGPATTLEKEADPWAARVGVP